MSQVGLLAFVVATWAAEPVVHGSGISDDQALAFTNALSGTPLQDLSGMSLDALTGREPALIGAGFATPCATFAGTPEQLRFVLVRVEAALGYGELDRAAGDLDEARHLAACLATPADPSVLSRFWMLAGQLAASRQKIDEAKADFSNALAVDSTAHAGDSWTPDARALFEEVATPTNPVPLTIVAPLPGISLTVDGRPAQSGIPVDIHPGTHTVLLQGAVSLAVEVVVDGPAHLVVPVAFPTEALSWAEDESERAKLSDLLAATLGEGEPAFVVSDESVWAATAGRTDWIRLGTVHRVVAKPIGRFAAIVGGTTALVGGAATLGSFLAADHAATAMTDAESYEAFDAATERYDSAVAVLRWSRFVAVGGGAVLAAGGALLGVTAKKPPILVEPVAGGAFGLGLGVRW